MRNELKDSEWVLGLYDFSSEQPDRTTFKEFYEAVVDVFNQLGATPTYIAAEGKGYTGKYVKIGGSVTSRLINDDFDGVTVLSIAANPVGSKDPSYDRFATANLSISNHCETVLCIAMNEGIERFMGNFFRQIVNRMLLLRNWSFGLGFSDKVKNRPDFHVLGIDNGKLQADEQSALLAWYIAQPEKKIKMLRGVYPMMMVNPEQLKLPAPDGRLMVEYLDSKAQSFELHPSGLRIYSIPKQDIGFVREELMSADVLII